MSDTPRTDDESIDVGKEREWCCVPTEFARRLETELATTNRFAQCWQEDAPLHARNSADKDKRNAELEAKLARATEALRFYAARGNLARTVLAELEPKP